MKPLPETDEALDELVGHDDRDLRAQLLEMGRQAKAIVPFCVGVSLTLVRERITLTLVSASEPALPETTPQREDVPDDVDPLSETVWLRDSALDAAQGVLSTLSLPILRGEQVIGGVSLYAASVHSFDGHHEELAAALGASASDAVTNADLSFSTRAAARRAPVTVAELRTVDVAVGTLAAWQRQGVEAAQRSLEEAARDADVTLVVAARLVLRLRAN